MKSFSSFTVLVFLGTTEGNRENGQEKRRKGGKEAVAGEGMSSKKCLTILV